MPRRRRDAVAERTEQRLPEQAERRREAAQRGAQTRRQRREAQATEAQPQAGGESRTQRHVRRRSRQPARPEMLTVAIRGPLAVNMREQAEAAGLSLAKLLGDMVLVYEGEIQGGYGPGTSLARWVESAAGSEA